jgi:hypothetical protein
MPIYEFESRDGERIERFFQASDVPRSIKENGKTFRKILSFPAFLVPDSFKAGYMDKRMRATMANNQEIADRIAKDPDQPSMIVGDDMTREAKADLNSRIAAATGRTRLG